jgi:hypothetical protein
MAPDKIKEFSFRVACAIISFPASGWKQLL